MPIEIDHQVEFQQIWQITELSRTRFFDETGKDILSGNGLVMTLGYINGFRELICYDKC